MTKLAMPILMEKVTTMRAENTPPKVIARTLGYSEGYIRNLLWRWKVRKSDKTVVALEQRSALQQSRDLAPNANVPAGSGSETGQLPDKGIS